jgi:hypothetical protein
MAAMAGPRPQGWIDMLQGERAPKGPSRELGSCVMEQEPAIVRRIST